MRETRHARMLQRNANPRHRQKAVNKADETRPRPKKQSPVGVCDDDFTDITPLVGQIVPFFGPPLPNPPGGFSTCYKIFDGARWLDCRSDEAAAVMKSFMTTRRGLAAARLKRLKTSGPIEAPLSSRYRIALARGIRLAKARDGVTRDGVTM